MEEDNVKVDNSSKKIKISIQALIYFIEAFVILFVTIVSIVAFMYGRSSSIAFYTLVVLDLVSFVVILVIGYRQAAANKKLDEKLTYSGSFSQDDNYDSNVENGYMVEENKDENNV